MLPGATASVTEARCPQGSPVNAEYEDKAKDMVREATGVDMSSGGVANKISRSGFSSAFFCSAWRRST